MRLTRLCPRIRPCRRRWGDRRGDKHLAYRSYPQRIAHREGLQNRSEFRRRSPTTVGNEVKIQNNVSVYEGVTLEDHVFCGSSMVFTYVFNPRSEISRISELRSTLVTRGATLGANSTILCEITIGRYAFVVAGAVMTNHVPDHALNRQVWSVSGWMCLCGVKLHVTGKNAACPTCGQQYRVERTGMTAV